MGPQPGVKAEPPPAVNGDEADLVEYGGVVDRSREVTARCFVEIERHADLCDQSLGTPLFPVVEPGHTTYGHPREGDPVAPDP